MYLIRKFLYLIYIKCFRKNGSSYMEAIVALGILVIVGGGILPLFPKALNKIDNLIKRDKLVSLAYYVSEYVNRWVDFSPNAKLVPFDFYIDGNELELSGDYRINRLMFIEPLLTTSNEYVVTDNYKVSIKFHETVSQNRAVVQVKVWFDENLNDVIDVSENVVEFSTIYLEKRK